MGQYWQFVCVTKDGTPVMRINPQRGLGGMKWGEYIGTKVGYRMIKKVLNEHFTPNGTAWACFGDAGGCEFLRVSAPFEQYKAPSVDQFCS